MDLFYRVEQIAAVIEIIENFITELTYSTGFALLDSSFFEVSIAQKLQLRFEVLSEGERPPFGVIESFQFIVLVTVVPQAAPRAGVVFFSSKFVPLLDLAIERGVCGEWILTRFLTFPRRGFFAIR